MKEIRKLVIQFTLFYDRYIRKFKGFSKTSLDLILFLIISTFGLMTLSVIYVVTIFILNPYLNNANQKINWIFVLLAVIFAISKIMEGFKNKRIY